MSTLFTQMESPIGPLLLASDDSKLREIRFVDGRHSAKPEPDWRENAAALKEPIRQRLAYFAAALQHFDLSLAPECTSSQQNVWNRLCVIPYFATISYVALA